VVIQRELAASSQGSARADKNIFCHGAMKAHDNVQCMSAEAGTGFLIRHIRLRPPFERWVPHKLILIIIDAKAPGAHDKSRGSRLRFEPLSRPRDRHDEPLTKGGAPRALTPPGSMRATLGL